jgi:hypothetical protein
MYSNIVDGLRKPFKSSPHSLDKPDSDNESISLSENDSSVFHDLFGHDMSKISEFLENFKYTKSFRGVFGSKDINVFDLICAHGNLFVRLKECNGMTSFLAAIYSYFRDVLNLSYSQFVLKYQRYIMVFMAMTLGVHTFYSNPPQQINRFLRRNRVAVQSGDKLSKFNFKKFLEDIKSALSHKDKVVDSDFANKFGAFCSLVICTPFFVNMGIDSTFFGFTDIYHEKLVRRYHNKHPVELAVAIVEGAIYITDKIAHYCETGDRSSFFLDDQEIVEYDRDFTLLSHYSDLPSSMASTMSVRDYLTKCDVTIERGKKLIAYFKKDRFKLSLLTNQQNSLNRFKLRAMDKLHVESHREAPIGICFYGTPGIGKSALIDKFLHCAYENERFIKGEGKSYDQSLKYMYNEDDDYFSEFKVSHEVCVIDDVDQFKDEINVQKKGGAMAKAIYLINPIPYITNQAALEDKGMIPFLCKYVIATTNTYDAGISKIFRKEGGAFRRFIFIEISVKPEYCKPGSTQLRGDLSDDGYTNHDLHDFRVRSYISTGAVSAPYYWDKIKNTYVASADVPVMSFAELSKFMFEHVQKPHYNQNRLTEKSVDHFLQSPFCPTCKVVKVFCSCGSAQAGTRADDGVDFLTPIGWILGTLLLFQMIYTWFLYNVHKMIGRVYNSDRPNWATRRLVAQLKRMPNLYRLPWWFKYMPSWLISYALCESWHIWLDKQCRLIHDKSILLQSYCEDKNLRRSLYGLVALGTIYYVVRKCSSLMILSGASAQSLSVEKPKNVWKVNYRDLSSLSGAPNTVTLEQLEKAIELNIVYFGVKTSCGKEVFTNGLGYRGNLVFVPRHWYNRIKPFFPCKTDIIREDVNTTAGSNRYNVFLDEANFSVYPFGDVMVLQHTSLSPFRDISKFIVDDMLSGSMEGVLLSRKETGLLNRYTVKAMTQSILTYTSDGDRYQYPGYKGYVDIPTQYGDCGGPYILRGRNGIVVAGFHVAAKVVEGRYATSAFACPLFNMDSDNSTFIPHSYDGFDLGKTYICEYDLQVKPVQHQKCPIRDTTGSEVIVFGSINTHRRKMKTNVKNTLMCQDVLDHYDLLEPMHISPAGISSHQATINNVDPMFEKLIFPQSYVTRAEQALYEWYSNTIEEYEMLISPCPLDMDSAINGIDGIAYMERMPVKTSGGFAHKGPKSKILVELPPTEEHNVRYGFNDDLTEEYERMLHNYREGKRNNIIWDFNFKDEPITHEKLRKQKCRIFNSGPAAFIALERQFFLWCIPLFSGPLRHKFGMAIGANCYGNDWKVLYDHITRHGTGRLIAGDYSKFDKRMSAQMMCAAFNVLLRIMRDNGWSESDICVARGIATDICYPISNCFGTIIETEGSNPSGHSLTTVINGMVNIMYIMIASMIIEEERGVECIDYSNFLDYCSILTYGDDNCMSCRYKWLNHVNISNALAKYGIIYTTADKESEIVPFIEVSQLDFLKRKFVIGLHGKGTVGCPLAEESIIKMLTVVTYNGNITFDHQCAEVISAANREYFQYGKERCDKEFEFLNSLVDKYELRPYLNDGKLLKYDEQYLILFDEPRSSKTTETEMSKN